MASFGSFETEREAYNDLVYAVYRARKQDDLTGQYAVKVFRLPDRGLESEVAPGASGRDELERARLNSIDLQEHAAPGSRFIAPIFERGNDSRGLWYATRFYPRSINKMMSGKVALPRDSLEHLIRAIAQGALDLKRACGRSHGDIQPTNVQVGNSERLTEAEVVLCDPMPGGPEHAEAYERNDLRSIGLILLQLVRQRTITKEDSEMMFSVGPGPEWARVFGNDAGKWLDICNRLLDPNLSVNQFSLETLVGQLPEFEPKRKGSPKLVAAAAGILALIIILGLWSLRPRRFNIELTSDPAGATVFVDGVKQGGTTPVRLKLKAGTHRLEARLEEIGLSSQSTNWLAGKGTAPTIHFRFQYGNVVIKSEPPGAAITKNGVSIGQTSSNGQPFQLTEIAAGPIRFELKLDQYEPLVLQGIVSNAQTLELSAQLRRSEIAKTSEVHNVATNKIVQTPITNPPAITNPAPVTNPPPVVSTGEIEFRAEPIAASVFDPAGKELGQVSPGSPLKRTLPAGKGVFVAKAQGLGDLAIELTVEPGGKTQHTFTFDYGTVDWASEPVSATVRLGAQSLMTPATFIQRPQVTYSYVITAAGYQSQTNDVSVRSGEKRRLVAKLTPRGMSLALVSDPPGAEFLMEDGSPIVRDKNNASLYSLPSGLRRIVARHPQLGLVTNQVELTQDGAATSPRFNFSYGTLVLTNFPPNLAVYEGDVRIGAIADQIVYQRTGNHRYTLRSQATSQDVQMVIQPGLNFFRFAVATAQTSWTNSAGMVFAWVPNLPGGGVWPGQSASGGWVGVSEVMQGQYKKMDGSNPSAYREGGDNYPVENVTWQQAINYCRWLSSSDMTERYGWGYTLPTDDQFTAFAADSERLPRVTAEGRMSYSMDELFPTQRGARVPTPGATGARTHPEPVGSTRQANQYGLYDVVGNVWEWLGRSGGKENFYAGGSYLNFSAKTVGTRARERTLERGPNIGFRVILVPAQ